MSALQERTGRIKWMKELREKDWGDYIRNLSKQIMSRDKVRIFLETYHEWLSAINDEAIMFCDYAKKQYDQKHEVEGVRLVWGYKHCDNPNCGTCLGTHNTHYPYPALASATEPFKFKPLSVRRTELKEFLMKECNFSSGQVDAFFILIDLRHLMVRRFNYLIMELKNLGAL